MTIQPDTSRRQPAGANDPVRCAAWTADAGVSPVGTATACRLFVLVEWPLPWPADVSEIAELSPLHAMARRLGGRVQCVTPAARRRDDDGLHEVAVLRADVSPSGMVGPYVEQSARVTGDALLDTAIALVESPELHAARNPGRRVLVCGHGRRDRCCGSMGTALALELTATELPPGVSVWRTSHLGGHRFAPTALVFPDATQWGLLDLAALTHIVRRTGSPLEVADRYRGFSGFADGAASVVDRYALGEGGWSWLDRPRRAEATDRGWWRITSDHGSGWEGSVRIRREVPVPPCGQPISAALKSERELVLDWAAPVAPPRPTADGRADAHEASTWAPGSGAPDER